MNATPVTIDVISDVVCPWCFIGMRRLEEALALGAAQGGVANVAVRWHPFELNPDLPPAGIARRDYVETKFGGAERAATRGNWSSGCSARSFSRRATPAIAMCWRRSRANPGTTPQPRARC